MYNWFEVKVSFELLENGTQKKVTEPYLIDALSFEEAEKRSVEELSPYISGEFTIVDIKRAKLTELFFNENGDRYFKAKISFIALDERSGCEKKTAVQMLAQACEIDEALAVIREGMKGTQADWYISSITETALVDVFPYSSETVKAKRCE